MQPLSVAVTTRAGEVVVPLHGTHTTEGHAAFSIRGGQEIEIAWSSPQSSERPGIEIGGIMRGGASPR